MSYQAPDITAVVLTMTPDGSPSTSSVSITMEGDPPPVYATGGFESYVPEIFGVAPLLAEGAIQTRAPMVSGYGLVGILGIGDFQSYPPKISGQSGAVGEFFPPIAEVSGYGLVGIFGTGNFETPKVDVSASAGVGHVAAVFFNAPVPRVSGYGAVSNSGRGNYNGPVPQVSGVGVVGITGVCAFSAPLAEVKGVVATPQTFTVIKYARCSA